MTETTQWAGLTRKELADLDALVVNALSDVQKSRATANQAVRDAEMAERRLVLAKERLDALWDRVR